MYHNYLYLISNMSRQLFKNFKNKNIALYYIFLKNGGDLVFKFFISLHKYVCSCRLQLKKCLKKNSDNYSPRMMFLLRWARCKILPISVIKITWSVIQYLNKLTIKSKYSINELNWSDLSHKIIYSMKNATIALTVAILIHRD